MNLNLSKVIEKIASDSKLSEEFSKLDEMDEIYDYCKNMGVKFEKKEFDNEISKYIDVLNDDTYEKEIFEEKLGNVGGGVNLKNKFSRSVASLLSALTMGSTAGLGSVGAVNDLKVYNNLGVNVPFSEKVLNEWSKTKEAFYKFYQKHKKIFIVVEVTVGVLVIAGAAILIKRKINDARAKKVAKQETTNKIRSEIEQRANQQPAGADNAASVSQTAIADEAGVNQESVSVQSERSRGNNNKGRNRRKVIVEEEAIQPVTTDEAEANQQAAEADNAASVPQTAITDEAEANQQAAEADNAASVPQTAITDEAEANQQAAEADNAASVPQTAITDEAEANQQAAEADNAASVPQTAITDEAEANQQAAEADNAANVPQTAIADEAEANQQPAGADNAASVSQTAIADEAGVNQESVSVQSERSRGNNKKRNQRNNRRGWNRRKVIVKEEAIQPVTTDEAGVDQESVSVQSERSRGNNKKKRNQRNNRRGWNRRKVIVEEEAIQPVTTDEAGANQRPAGADNAANVPQTAIVDEAGVDQESVSVQSERSRGNNNKGRNRRRVTVESEAIEQVIADEAEARRQKAAIDREKRYNLIISAREKSMKKSRENSTFKKLVEDWNNDPTEENFEAIKKFVEDHKEGNFLGKYEELFPRNMYLQAVKNNSTAENWDAVYSNPKLYNKKIRARAKAMRDMERLREAGKQGIFERFFSSKNLTALSQEAEKSVSEAEKLGVKGIREVFDELKRELKLK